MELINALRERAQSIVIVDDHFSGPTFPVLDGEDLTKFYNLLEGSAESKARVSQALGVADSVATNDLVAIVEGKAEELWPRYQAGDPAYSDFEMLFERGEATHAGESHKLNILVSYCRDQLAVEPATFSTLREAGDALRDCMIAFVDFYLAGESNEQSAIDAHIHYREHYREGFEFNTSTWPKLVFLISSKLPAIDHLQSFRSCTGLRSAFFSPLRKGDFSEERFKALFSDWNTWYPAKSLLNRYLTTMSTVAHGCATDMASDIDRFELHDLTLLDTLKLSADNESLQSYLTWLLSESLASKIRSSPLLREAFLPARSDFPKVDGKLMPQSILFDLFADVASAPIKQETARPGFGDIYSMPPKRAIDDTAKPQASSQTNVNPAEAVKVRRQASGHLISPVIDLIRRPLLAALTRCVDVLQPAPALSASEYLTKEPAETIASAPGTASIIGADPAVDKKPTQDLLLVISPACDLARCSIDDQVLCVKGTITQADPRLESLLYKKSLYGKGSHVIRYINENRSEYAHVQWTLNKGLITVPVSVLADRNAYKRISTLTELFAQEVKDLALADASRIGIPVDPSVSVVGTVIVRTNIAQGQGIPPALLIFDLSDRDFVSAIFTKGRDGDDSVNVLVFTQQFSDWLFSEFFPAVRAELVNQVAIVENVESFFRALMLWHIAIPTNKLSKAECGGALTFRHTDKAIAELSAPSKGIEITVLVQKSDST
jgi:hypothetical protein